MCQEIIIDKWLEQAAYLYMLIPPHSSDSLFETLTLRETLRREAVPQTAGLVLGHLRDLGTIITINLRVWPRGIYSSKVLEMTIGYH